MTKQFRIEHKLETQEIVEIELTNAEIAELEEIKTKVIAQQRAEAVKAEQRTALLAKLGITEEEARLLLS
jgi:RNA-binding protein YhbY